MSRAQLVVPVILVLASVLTAGEELSSGPRVGTNMPGPFHPLVVHFPKDPIFVGKRMDFADEGFGPRPVIMIFVRGLSDPQASLFTRIDAKLAQNREMRGLAVWLSTFDDELPEKLKGLGRTQALNHLVLAIDKVAGPTGYNIAKEADLTVILYDKRKVLANHAYRRGELNEKAIARIISGIDDKLIRRSQ